MKVKDVMTRGITKVSPETPALEIATLLMRHDVGSVLVEENGSIRGIITATDLIAKVVKKDRDAKTITAKHLMSKPVIMIDGEEELFKAINMMKRYKIRRITVIVDGNPAGVLSATQIAKDLKKIVK
jgi:CBS domain-containing protein